VSLWPTSTIFNFKIVKILAADEVRRLVMRQHVKFNQNRMNGCRDLAI